MTLDQNQSLVWLSPIIGLVETLSHKTQRCYIFVFFFFEFFIPPSSPIWIENYENCVSTSSMEGDCVLLEVLGCIQNTMEEFGGIEGKIWELWKFWIEKNWLFCMKFIGGGDNKGKKGRKF